MSSSVKIKKQIKVCLFELCTLFSTVCIALIISWTEWILNKYNILDRMDTKHTSRDCLEIDLKCFSIQSNNCFHVPGDSDLCIYEKINEISFAQLKHQSVKCHPFCILNILRNLRNVWQNVSAKTNHGGGTCQRPA
jgi:hypothetical protein